MHKKSYSLMCSLTRVLLKKSLWQYFKNILILLKIDRAYSFLLVTFFANISAASSFKDDRGSKIFQQVRFLNCFACLSLKTVWNYPFGKALFLSCLPFLAKQKSRLFLFHLKSKYSKQFMQSGNSELLVYVICWWWQRLHS